VVTSIDIPIVTCRKTYWQEYYHKNREKIIQKNTLYNKLHPEKNQAYKKKWRAKHLEREKVKERARCKKYREEHPLYFKKYRKKYYGENALYLNQKSKEYRKEHLVERKEYEKEYRQGNSEEIRQKKSRYSKLNRVKLTRENREYRHTHLNQCHLYSHTYYQRLRYRVLLHYSINPKKPVCACKGCKENHFPFLTLDHINGNGKEHRQKLGSQSVYNWAEKHNYPAGLQVLCFNCNMSKRKNKCCPVHKGSNQKKW